MGSLCVARDRLGADLPMVGNEGAREFETGDELQGVLPNLGLGCAVMGSPKLAPRCIPGASLAAPVNPIVDFPFDHHRVFVNIDAFLFEPPGERGLLRKEVVFDGVADLEPFQLTGKKLPPVMKTPGDDGHGQCIPWAFLRASPISPRTAARSSDDAAPISEENRCSLKVLAAIDPALVFDAHECDAYVFLFACFFFLRLFPRAQDARCLVGLLLGGWGRGRACQQGPAHQHPSLRPQRVHVMQCGTVRLEREGNRKQKAPWKPPRGLH